MRAARAVAAAAATLALAAAARGDDPAPAAAPSAPARAASTGLARALPPNSDDDLPRIRLEAHFRGGSMRTEAKLGVDTTATKFETHEDAHVPDALEAFGWRVVIDAAIHRWISVGFHGTRLVEETPSRALHYRGVGLGRVTFAGDGGEVRVTQDDLVLGGTVRLVVQDSDALRLSVGLGAAWAKHRIVLRRGDVSASGSVSATWLPTISTFLSVRLGPLPVSVFVESWTGLVAPWRFPSLLSDFTTGLRWHLGPYLELITAVGSTSGRIEDTKDLWGGKPSPTETHRRVNWVAWTFDVGLAVTF